MFRSIRRTARHASLGLCRLLEEHGFNAENDASRSSGEGDVKRSAYLSGYISRWNVVSSDEVTTLAYQAIEELQALGEFRRKSSINGMRGHKRTTPDGK